MGRHKECKDGGPERDSNEAGRCEDRKPEGDAEAESGSREITPGVTSLGRKYRIRSNEYPPWRRAF